MNRATSVICTSCYRVLCIKFETLGSPRVLNSLPRLHLTEFKSNFYLEVGHRGTIIIKTNE